MHSLISLGNTATLASSGMLVLTKPIVFMTSSFVLNKFDVYSCPGTLWFFQKLLQAGNDSPETPSLTGIAKFARCLSRCCKQL